jgi:hypothetical protein
MDYGVANGVAAAIERNKRGRYRDNDPVWKADSGYPRGGKFEVADQWE